MRLNWLGELYCNTRTAVVVLFSRAATPAGFDMRVY